MASGSHFPNGISTRTKANDTSAAGAGDLDCQDMFTAGTTSSVQVSATSINTTGLTVAEDSLIGQIVNVSVTFASATIAQEVYVPVPIGGHVIRATVVAGVTVALTTLHTLIVDTVGTTLATITNASGTQGKITIATMGTGSAVSVTTSQALHFRRAVSGTAGNTFMSAVIAVQ